ncbi:DddA-like double-stranded DNA deaminase toxin [Streptomyces sp. NPDC008343]|uniref:DddA-like double-stranded DNA deaminase toxin n=1 Tax=Streptomyces sp. NPDC008343 TaxID=3364828 RepID=UPI0036E948C5
MRFNVQHSKVQDHRPEFGSLFGLARLPIGHFTLEPVGPITGLDWRLGLRDAELTGTLTTDKGTLTLRALVHNDRSVLAVEVTPSAGERDFRWVFHPADAISPPAAFKPLPDGYRGNPAAEVAQHDGVWGAVQPLLAGGQHVTAWRERSTGRARTVYVRALGMGESIAALRSFAQRALPKFATKGRTTGIGTANGRVFQLTSGTGSGDKALLGIVNDRLRKAGALPGTVRSGNANHVEQKFAAIMVAQKVDRGEIFINHPGGPCPLRLGCDAALPLIPGERKLTVHWPDGKGGFQSKPMGEQNEAGACGSLLPDRACGWATHPHVR